MLVEQRTYTAHPGKWRDYMALYQTEGLELQQRILGRMVGYYTSDSGPLNQIVHLWAYTDLNERAERRARLLAEPRWQAYVRSEEHTSELQSPCNLVCRLLLEKKNRKYLSKRVSTSP